MVFRPNPKPDKREKKKPQPIKRTAIKYKPHDSGQVDMFAEIWAERPHRCEICGDPLGDEALAGYFFHVLPKGTYKLFMNEKRNILLACWSLSDVGHCHNMYHDVPRSELIVDPKWKRVFDLYDDLKSEYNGAK